MLERIIATTRKLLPYVGVMAISLGVGCGKRPKSFGVYESDGTTFLLEAEYTQGCIEGFDPNYRGMNGEPACVEGINLKFIKQIVNMPRISEPEFLVYLADPTSIKDFGIYDRVERDRACFDKVSGRTGRQCSDFYYKGKKKIPHSTEPEGEGLFRLRAESLMKEIKEPEYKPDFRSIFGRELGVYVIYDRSENKGYLFRIR